MPALHDAYRYNLRMLMEARGMSGKAGRGRTLLAEDMGVSEATLARAIRGDKLRKKTVEKLEAAIEALTYRIEL